MEPEFTNADISVALDALEADPRKAWAIEMVQALGVIALDPEIKAWLKANDPKALEQVQKALEQVQKAIRNE